MIVESCEDQKSFTNTIMRSVRVDAFYKFSSGEYGSVDVKYYKENKEGVKYMSSVLRELREEGRAEYMVKAVRNAMKLSGMTLEKACELFGCTIEEYKEALQLMQSKDKFE